MNKEVQKDLARPFPPEAVGKKPVITCKACSESRTKVCDDHKKFKCGTCGNYITRKHDHLDFVGHAYVTERLLSVDPNWNWRPLSMAANGMPLLDDNGGLWIELTIHGVSRLGYGDADGKRGGKAVKEAIGDAIRNAGMRFGVALEMWKKESPRDTGEDVPERQMDRPAQTPEEQKTELRGQIAMVGRAKQMTIEQIAAYFHEWSYGKYDITTANERVLGEFLGVLRAGKP